MQEGLTEGQVAPSSCRSSNLGGMADSYFSPPWYLSCNILHFNTQMLNIQCHIALAEFAWDFVLTSDKAKLRLYNMFNCKWSLLSPIAISSICVWWSMYAVSQCIRW